MGSSHGGGLFSGIGASVPDRKSLCREYYKLLFYHTVIVRVRRDAGRNAEPLRREAGRDAGLLRRDAGRNGVLLGRDNRSGEILRRLTDRILNFS